MKKDVIDMMKKILIPVLIACSLFVVSMSSVLAADETETITDDEDYVIDWLSETEEDMFVSNKPNIDIVKVIYERQDDVITLTLTVKGEIEDRGDIDAIGGEAIEDIDYVSYVFALYMSEAEYGIYYVNGRCQLGYYLPSDDEPSLENISENDFSVDGSNLTISFALKNTSETYESMEVVTEEAKLSSTTYEWFVDYAPDFEEGGDGNGDDDDDGDDDGDDDVDGDGNGNTGTDDSSNSGILLFVAVIGVIAVIGVAVLVYIIRR